MIQSSGAAGAAGAAQHAATAAAAALRPATPEWSSKPWSTAGWVPSGAWAWS